MPRARVRTRVAATLATAGLLLSGCANTGVGSDDDDPTEPVTVDLTRP